MLYIVTHRVIRVCSCLSEIFALLSLKNVDVIRKLVEELRYGLLVWVAVCPSWTMSFIYIMVPYLKLGDKGKINCKKN